MTQEPLFLVHSIDKDKKTLLIELNERVINDILNSIDDRLIKLPNYADQADQEKRLISYRDKFHLNLPKLK